MATNDTIFDNAIINGSITDDPIVREVRNIRLDIERECGPGHDAYYKFLLSIQNGMRDRLVRGEPMRLVRDTG
uniref:Uncharacterized protein n=1 Tax=Candidatus Kentrum sp. UNK TaxID=2126344 RepID=A0A451AYI7_9GAMM|nr:MAG: hypothetical protein BECKUNK1418G_GA0071005_104712 [Candidatus Kentron sp. UNK]VFK71112.1 MAG: hypothetical protein BECKUNK1418H_GA0071006_105112 [Candidatus Kentron sp. UNK]